MFFFPSTSFQLPKKPPEVVDRDVKLERRAGLVLTSCAATTAQVAQNSRGKHAVPHVPVPGVGPVYI